MWLNLLLSIGIPFLILTVFQRNRNLVEACRVLGHNLKIILKTHFLVSDFAHFEFTDLILSYLHNIPYLVVNGKNSRILYASEKLLLRSPAFERRTPLILQVYAGNAYATA